MRSVERRNFLKVAVALPFSPPLREHHGPRAGTHLDFKVLTKDTQADGRSLALPVALAAGEGENLDWVNWR